MALNKYEKKAPHKMRLEDMHEFKPVEVMSLSSMSSSSMSSYDMDVEDLEIELRRERIIIGKNPHIVVGEASHSWEQDERWHKYFTFDTFFIMFFCLFE